MSNALSNNDKENTSQVEEKKEVIENECKYCQKKFRNKQALGGHQNAHRFERSIEKSVRDMHKNQFELFTGHPSHPMIASPYSSGSYRSQELINRSLGNNPYRSHYAPYPRPRINPTTQPLWNVPVTKVPPFAPPTPYVLYGSLNAGFPTIASGDSNMRPVLENFSFSSGSRVAVSENLGGKVNTETTFENQQLEDSTLDLSLRL